MVLLREPRLVRRRRPTSMTGSQEVRGFKSHPSTFLRRSASYALFALTAKKATCQTLVNIASHAALPRRSSGRPFLAHPTPDAPRLRICQRRGKTLRTDLAPLTERPRRRCRLTATDEEGLGAHSKARGPGVPVRAPHEILERQLLIRAIRSQSSLSTDWLRETGRRRKLPLDGRGWEAGTPYPERLFHGDPVSICLSSEKLNDQVKTPLTQSSPRVIKVSAGLPKAIR